MDTMEPICKPMAEGWQTPFASSRGYSSITLQHDVALMLKKRRAVTGQTRFIIYFVSDHDPSGFDLQRAWEQAMDDFGVTCKFVRIGLTTEQIRNPLLDIERLFIEVKVSDSRSKKYIAEHGDRCWEADILPASVIEEALNGDIRSWLDAGLLRRRKEEIERARSLL